MSEPRRETIIHFEPDVTDERGGIWNLLSSRQVGKVFHATIEKELPLQWWTHGEHVAVITSTAGSVRANHWHPIEVKQIMFLVSGEYEMVNQEIDSKTGLLIPGTRTEQLVRAGDISFCPAYLAHAYRFTKDSIFLNLNLGDRDPSRFDKHTIRLPEDSLLIRP